MAQGDSGAADEQQPWEYTLRKYLLLLASLVATVAYGAGFSPPGGAWQDSVAGEHTAGDPILRSLHYGRYLVFFYCNATAFASSLLVIVLILLFAVLHEKKDMWITVMPLLMVMVLDLLSLMGAYAAGTCRDAVTARYTLALVATVFVYLVVQMVLASLPVGEHDYDHEIKERPRKVLLLLATFATSLTYVAGLSTPGGFWPDSTGGHRAGEAVMGERHPARLTAFLLFNTTAFVASLLIIVLLLDRKLRDWSRQSWELYGCVVVSLIGLVGAYAAGSSRVEHTTVYVVALAGAVLVYIAFQATVVPRAMLALRQTKLARIYSSMSKRRHRPKQQYPDLTQATIDREAELERAMEKARSLVLLLATLAATVTYQAALDPPGGYWQDNGQGHKAGDPILLTTNPRRYKTFFYCNSTAFLASLLAIILVQSRSLLERHALEAAMILDLFGLMGAYAAGSCRDASTSIYVLAIAGAVLVYVVIHVVFFTLDHTVAGHSEDVLLEKRRKRLLLFAILSATITYQAGLTPPSGFWQAGDLAGMPVLFSNNPHRYRAFFYCNTTSFMSSVALIILLVNPNLYRPAIRSYALSVCMVAGMLGLMGAYAAGSSQHLRTSVYVFVLVVTFVVLLLVVFVVRQKRNPDEEDVSQRSQGNLQQQQNLPRTDEMQVLDDGAAAAATLRDAEREQHTKRKYLMLLGILAASITYQAGLHPPGGVWQSDGDGGDHGYAAGDPVMRYNRIRRYRAFFYSNSTSFMASVVVVVLLLVPLPDRAPVLRQVVGGGGWLLQAMNATVVLDMVGLLVAYGAGSSREWETSGYVIAMAIVVLGYFAIHATLSTFSQGDRRSSAASQRVVPRSGESPEAGNGWREAQGSSV